MAISISYTRYQTELRIEEEEVEESPSQELSIPTQIFLWQQISPFIRPKLGKHHEATCTFCQQAPGHHDLKEAAKLFEKILVQNIQFGLSPNLANALMSIPRWRLVQSAFPYVMHSVSSLLHSRRDTNLTNIGLIETKLLYTLHWILADAADECAQDSEDDYQSSPFHYLFSIPAISLFIYLFAPLCHNLKESDFQHTRIENGLKIWQAMWEYQHPTTPCFTAHVKPKCYSLSKMLKSSQKFGDIFIGRKRSSDTGFHLLESPPSQVSASGLPEYTPGVSTAKVERGQQQSEEDNWVSSPKDLIFPETIPEESSSTEEEHMVVLQLSSTLTDSDKFLESIFKAEPSVFRFKSKTKSKSIAGPDPTLTASDSKVSKADVSSQNLSHHADKKSSLPLESTRRSKSSVNEAEKMIDLCAATFLDVAVLRCLFISQWQEEGVYWALQYLYHRLRVVSEDVSSQQQSRRRSSSLPNPKIEVSFFQSPELKKKECKDLIEVPEVKDVSYLTESPYFTRKHSEDSSYLRRGSEKLRKKIKMMDLKTFVETKLLSKSEKTLEKIGQDDQQKELSDQEYHRSLDREDDRPCSAFAKIFEAKPDCLRECSNLVKGKSMPSLRYIGESFSESLRLSKTTPSYQVNAIQNPIITVTEHTPIPSPDYTHHEGSISSQLDVVSHSDVKVEDRKPSMTRSYTDSNISYSTQDTMEATGVSSYVTKEGDLDYLVILKAVHSVALRDNACCTLRVCEVVLNIVEILIDMGVLKENFKDDATSTNGTAQFLAELKKKKKYMSSQSKSSDMFDEREDEFSEATVTPFSLVLNCVLRVVKHLGCPHGCADGQRGPPADFLRSQAQILLSKLHRNNSKQFSKLLRDIMRRQGITEILDFFHAYVGFCVDPSSLLSPMNQKRSCNKSPDIGNHGGYATNFGAGLGRGGPGGIEGQIMMSVFKILVTRFAKNVKEFKAHENMALYCDIRQFMTYVKEAHGGVFRRVALSALLDSAERPNRNKSGTQTTRVIRRVNDPNMDEQQDTGGCFILEERGSKKMLFKKRSTSSTCGSLLETEFGDDMSKISQSPLNSQQRKHPVLTPRQSEKNICVTDTDLPTLSVKTRKSSRFQIGGIVNWFRKDYDHSDSIDSHDDSESPADSGVIRQPSFHQQKGSQKYTSGTQVGQTLQKAKKKVEDHFTKFGFGRNKRKDGGSDDATGGYLSRRNSLDLDHSRDSEFVILKERKMVPITPVFSGMQRFSFLLETCQPGSIPDPPLIAAVLDLPHVPVVSRAAFILECSYFVHCCNKGQWPSWMKLNFPIFRPSGPTGNRSASTGARRTCILQRTAGKLFYQWGEALGSRLEAMLQEDKQNVTNVISMMTDETRQKELFMEDEEEDFLDEASVTLYGTQCPLALRLVACMLLLEITSFLRETYQSLPKYSRTSVREKHPPWERMYSKDVANRRWSMALSSMGQSQASAQSLQSIAGEREPTVSGVQAERKISFVLHEPDNESEGSSNTTVTMQGEDGQAVEEKKSRRPPPPGRPFLLRRGTAGATTGSFKRRSLKLTRPPKELSLIESSYPMQTSKRKVSSFSDRSDNSEQGGAGEVSGEESPGILSDDQPPESPSDTNDNNDFGKNLPWMKAMVQLASSFNFYCSHQTFCHPFCYRRHMRACSRLIKAVRRIYGEEFGILKTDGDGPDLSGDKHFSEDVKKEKYRGGRKISDQVSIQASPIRREDSLGKKHRLDSNGNGSQSVRLLGSHRDSSRDLADHDSDNEHVSVHAIDGKKSKFLYQKPKDRPLILKYLKCHVRETFHPPLAIMVKGAVILTEDFFVDILPVAWELLLESNQEVVASAASIFILSAVKEPQQATEKMHSALHHQDPAVRIGAILRFQVLWKLRYQIWPRMEEGAHMAFKVPPPGIDFTLPSPKIGIESLPVVDPPWMPQVKTQLEDMTTISEESHRALVTATKTRKKQQTELIEMNLQAQEDKKRMERENFLITTIPIAMQAAYEPSFYHAIGDDHDDTNIGDDEPENTQRNASHHNIHSAQALFPSCLCSAVIQIVNMLEDAAVSPDGNAVYEVAYQVIWNCLVEDSTLFLRYVLERLTRDTQELMFKILRHLIRFVPKLPQQAAFTLYNYIIGYVMFYVRSPQEDGQKYIGTALSILWMVVHSVHGIMFKDLKQILRKEQCDASILLTANVPAAKKIVVHGPQEAATGGIPSQFPIQEDTKFTQILKESLNFFSIEEEHHKEYCLVDYKTRQIHNPSSYVRDFYFFKRSQYPQLELIYMKEKDLYNALQRQELLHKFTETGKVLLTWAILKNVDMVVQRVVFLHEELIKLPAFPRKALEADLDLCKGGELGKELLGLDVLHKFMWVRLIARMFEAMAGNFAYSGDIHLFLNVLNGALILHSEDACILRYVTATYINAAHHFKNIFALNGYLLIMPTLLQLYSNHQTNKLVKTTVEYAVKQFYLMNRKPFILQMFGSVSSILDTDEESQFGDAYKVQSSCLFNLLLSLEDPSPDPLNIGELVKEEKPLKAIDFCYHDESEMVTVLDCISLCVMVVAYSAGSVRGHQMLIILEAILPCYVQHIQLPFYNNIMGKTEKEILHQLAIAVRTLISNCEPLTKHYSGPQSSSPEHRGSSQRNYSRGQYSTAYDFDEDSRSKYNVSDHSRSKGNHENATLQDLENQQVQRNEFRRPRDILLSLVADFFVKSTARLSELNRKNPDGKTVELLDSKSYDRLAEVSISLLKVSTYNPDTMACRGLQRFMNELLPTAEWEETPRTPLNNVLRRLEKTFSKISKKPGLRRNTDWDAASGLLKGIYETLCHNPHIVNAPSLRALINVCQSLIVGDSNSGASEGVSSASVAAMNQVPPAHFCSTVVRLIALQIFIIGEAYSLEQVSGGNSVLSTPEKTEKILLNLIMPLFLRVGNSRKDIPRMRQADVSFALSIVTQTLCPPTSKNAGTNTAHHIKAVSDTRAGSFTYSQRDNKKPVKVSISLYQVSFLALKTLMVSLESDLVLEWPKIARVVREVGKRTEVGPIFWNFIDFVVTHRSPLYVLIYPFILQKLKQMPISDEERHLQFVVREKISGYNMPAAKCKVSMITELAHEMKVLKEELEDLRYDEQNDSKKTNTADTHIISEMTTHTRTHRPSLIMDFLTGEHGLLTRDRGDHGGNNAGSNPGAGGESIPLRQQVLQKGETSTTPLSPASPADESSGECSGQVDSKPPRLQRSKAQSRKTFRLRKSRKNRDGPHMKVEQEEESTLINGRHKEQQKYEEQEEQKKQQQQQQQQQQPKQLLQPHDDSEERQSVIELSIQSESSATLESQPLRVYHPMVRMPSTETSSGMRDSSWDEVSCTSNTSGYRESYSLLMTNSPPTPVPAVSIPRVPPPLASPDLHDLPSTSSVTTTNVVTTEGSSPDISMNSTGEEDTALIGRFDQTLSQHSLLMQYDIQDEDTLI